MNHLDLEDFDPSEAAATDAKIKDMATKIMADKSFKESILQIEKYLSSDEASIIRNNIEQEFLENTSCIRSDPRVNALICELKRLYTDLESRKSSLWSSAELGDLSPQLQEIRKEKSAIKVALIKTEGALLRKESESSSLSYRLPLNYSTNHLQSKATNSRASLQQWLFNFMGTAQPKRILRKLRLLWRILRANNDKARKARKSDTNLKKETIFLQTAQAKLRQALGQIVIAERRIYALSPAIKVCEESIVKTEASLQDLLFSILRENLALVLNKHLRKIYSPSTDKMPPWLNAWGVSEVFLSDYEIITEHHMSLMQLMEDMPGGSIGISGPRGSGKTTLMWSLCGKDAVNRLHGKPVRSLMVSAPVKYDARDFALHIFAEFCNMVLDLTRSAAFVPINPPNLITEDSRASSEVAARHLVDSRMLRTAKISGSLLILISLLYTYLVAFRMPIYKQVLEPKALIVSPRTTSKIATTINQQHAGNAEVFAYKYILALGLKPGSLFFGGVTLVLFGLLLSPVKKARSSEEKRGLRFRLGLASETDSTDSANSEEAKLRRYAIRCLEDIQFQHSYTSGQAALVKLPALLDSSSSNATTLQRMRATFPEIVNEYKSFARYAMRVLDIAFILGIDELDKLEVHNAHLFLNDTKALFGLENCFYLITVSEDAMSSFELRGIPFRDVFDSTFDAIYHVDCLSYGEARHLVDKRVIGLPALLFAFIYCIAGGLPREIIRACRNAIRAADGDNPASTDGASVIGIIRHEISRDIQSKVRSIYVQGKSLFMDRYADCFLRTAMHVEQGVKKEMTPELLLEVCGDLGTIVEAASRAEQEEAEPSGVARLATEFQSYLYYMTTLLEVFNDAFCRGMLEETDETKALFTSLAEARRFFSVKPSFGLFLVSEIRQAMQLSVI